MGGFRNPKVYCITLGDTAVGKTCMLTKFSKNTFAEEHITTVRRNTYTRSHKVDGNLYDLVIKDASDTDDLFDNYSRLTRYHPQDLDVILLCFSVVRPPSLENVKKKWMAEVRRHAPSKPCLLVGLKIDLRDDTKTLEELCKYWQTPITKKQGELLAANLSGARTVKYVECSALTGEGLKSVFDEAVRVRKEIPLNILERGPKALNAYLEASKHGTRPVYRTRIMLVGHERVGKTSLMNSLIGEKFKRSSPITDGVDTSKVCQIPLAHAHSVWHQQPMEKDDRAKQMKDKYIEAMCHDIAQNLLHAEEEASSAKPLETSKEKQPRRKVEGAQRPSMSPKIGTNHLKIKARTRTSNADSNGKDSKALFETTVTPVSTEDSRASPPELPEEIAKGLKKRGRQEDEPALEFQFWDFAGQDLYYNTHQVFLNRRAVFVLVFDLSKDLNEPVEVAQVNFAKKGLFQKFRTASRFHSYTGFEFLDFWLQSIYTYATASETKNMKGNPCTNSTRIKPLPVSGAVPKRGDDERQPHKSPPIVIVGTHLRDLRKRAIEEDDMKAQIFAAIKGKPYEEHIVRRIHFIENNPKRRAKGDEEFIDELRKHISEIALNEPYMGEMIPIRWLQFESTLVELASGQKPYITLMQAKELAAGNAITDADEVVAVLQFFHDLGTIVYFGSGEDGSATNPSLKDLVILDAQWLIDIFKTIITVKPNEKQWSTYCSSWRMLGDKGILKDSLINHVWKDHLHLKTNLLALMEKFDLLCPRFVDQKEDKVDQEEMTYYVPSCLQPSPSQQEDAMQDANNGSFYFNFFDYLPDCIFNYIVIYTARWSQEKSGIAPKLFHRLGRFTVGAKRNRHSLEIQMVPAKPACIKVLCQRKQVYGDEDAGCNPSPEMCEEVIQFMTKTMEELQRKWVGGVQLELSVACLACRNKRSTLHLIKLTINPDDEVYCEFTEDHIRMRAYAELLGKRTDVQASTDAVLPSQHTATASESSTQSCPNEAENLSWDLTPTSSTYRSSSSNSSPMEFIPKNTLATVNEMDVTFKSILGHGGFGEVFLATHKHWGDVATKRLNLSNDAIAEVKQMWRTITSPYLVRIMGIIDDPDNPSIVMEFFKYGSLMSFLQYMVGSDVLPMKVKMILDIIQGMNYLHTLRSPVIHRDLKCDNIFVAEGFQAKVGDLGLAVCTTSVKTKAKADLAGTVTHIPPEAWAGTVTKPTPFFDVYSFGITLYEILSNGKDPWPQTRTFANEALLSMWITNGHRPSLDEIPKDTPVPLLDTMKTCWAGEPTERPTFQELQSKFMEMYSSEYEKEIISADKKILDNLSQQKTAKESSDSSWK